MTTAAERLKYLSGLAGVSAAVMLLAIGNGATTGDALLDYSPLPTGTAAEHLLAEIEVQPEAGGGAAGFISKDGSIKRATDKVFTTDEASNRIVTGRRITTKSREKIDWSEAAHPLSVDAPSLPQPGVGTQSGELQIPTTEISGATQATAGATQKQLSPSDEQLAILKRRKDEEALLLILLEIA